MRALMSITLMTGAIAMLFSPAIAGEKKQTPAEFCRGLESMAETIMSARQAGVAMSKVMEIVKDDEVYQGFVMDAYDISRYSTEEYRRRSIEDFKNAKYLVCMKALRKR